MEELLSKPGGVYRGLDATRSRMSRRELLRYTSSTAVVTAIGMAGLLELLENREAIAQGMVIELVGVTREPNFPEETPHRHTCSARFQPTRITPSTIVGDVTGRTQAVISTGIAKEDQHFHDIQGTGDGAGHSDLERHGEQRAGGAQAPGEHRGARTQRPLCRLFKALALKALSLEWAPLCVMPKEQVLK